MEDRAGDGAPPSRRRGPLSSRPAEERATPVADASTDYAAYIAASGTGKDQTRATVRVQVEDLARLRDASRKTGTTTRSPDLVEAIDRAANERRPGPRRWGRALLLLSGVAVLAAGALWFMLPRAPLAPTEGPPTSAVAVTPSAVAVTAAPATSAPAELVAAIPLAESQARAALERLRGGLDACIRHGIHAIPGSSPAVPTTLGALQGGAYASTPAEWRTAVWSCAHFQMNEPMRFQLQWQLLKPGADGLAIAWIDANGDGRPDQALGFHVTLGPRGEPVLGEIGPAPASQAVIVVR